MSGTEQKKGILVYIAHPYSSNPHDNAVQSCKVWRAVLAAGMVPINPLWSHLQQSVTPMEWYEWMRYDLALLKCVRPDAILRVPGVSCGADLEVAWADDNGVPVFFTVDALVVAFEDQLLEVVA